MTIRKKLEEYDLFDQAITKHGMLEYNRDYELIGFLNGQFDELEVRYLFKGCVRVELQNLVDPQHYLMDDRLLDINKQSESDYPEGFIWGQKFAVPYPGWILIEDSKELTNLEEQYGFKLCRIEFETNIYQLNLIFHDLEIEVIKQTEKKSIEQ